MNSDLLVSGTSDAECRGGVPRVSAAAIASSTCFEGFDIKSDSLQNGQSMKFAVHNYCSKLMFRSDAGDMGISDVENAGNSERKLRGPRASAAAIAASSCRFQAMMVHF